MKNSATDIPQNLRLVTPYNTVIRWTVSTQKAYHHIHISNVDLLNSSSPILAIRDERVHYALILSAASIILIS